MRSQSQILEQILRIQYCNDIIIFIIIHFLVYNNIFVDSENLISNGISKVEKIKMQIHRDYVLKCKFLKEKHKILMADDNHTV